MDDEHDVAEALVSIARAIHRLGNADAATAMGGLEAHGMTMHEGLLAIASALNEVARALSEISVSLDQVADAIGRSDSGA